MYSIMHRAKSRKTLIYFFYYVRVQNKMPKFASVNRL